MHYSSQARVALPPTFVVAIALRCCAAMDEAALAKELRRLRRERKRVLKTEDEPSEADLDTALLVVWHSMGDLRLGQQYLRECRARQKRRRSCAEGHVSLSPQASAKRPPAPEECPQSWYRALENRWMAWSMDDEVAALVTVGPRETRSSRAKSFVDGAHLETYLQRQNQKGIAPGDQRCCARATLL